MRSVVLAALILAAPFTARATPTDFNFKDVELACIFQTIAVIGRFNVLVDPQVARAKMVVSLRQMEPLDALHAIAGIQELRVKRLESKIELGGAMTETYLIGRADKITQGFERGLTRTLLLRYATPAEVCRALAPHTEANHAKVKVSVDERSNRLVMFGSGEEMDALEKLVREIDRPAQQVRLQMFLVAGQAGKPEPVWQGSTMLVNARPSRFELAGGGKATTHGWRVAKLAGDAHVRVNPEGYTTVTVALDVTAEDRGVTSQLKLHAQQQLNPGQEAEASSIEVSPGQVLTLRLMTTPVVVTPPSPAPLPAELDRPTVPTPAEPMIDLDEATPPPPPSPAPSHIDGLDLEGI